VTREQIEEIRRRYAIEGELRIIESIRMSDFSSVTEPNILGSKILRECVDRIRGLNHA